MRQFVHGLDDVVMIGEMLRELTALEDINGTSSEWILI